jgi:hypothetical protein
MARVHVNARPSVKSDPGPRLVSLDTLQFILKSDRDASIRTDVLAALSRPALRDEARRGARRPAQGRPAAFAGYFGRS